MARLLDRAWVTRRKVLETARAVVGYAAAAGLGPAWLSRSDAQARPEDNLAAEDRSSRLPPDPVAILGPKLVAWFDDTDPSTLFQDPAGTVPIVPDGTVAQRTVALQRAKSFQGPGISALTRVQPELSRRPVWEPDAYNGGRAGLVFDGVDDGLISRGITLGDEAGRYAVVVAAQFLSTDSFGPLLSAYHGGWTNGEYWQGGEQNAFVFRVNDRIASFDDASAIAASGAGVGAVGRWSVESDGTSIVGYASGVQRFHRPVARPIGHALDIGYWTSLGGGAGAPVSSGYAVRGVEQHAILTRGPVTTAEREAVDAYLSATQGNGAQMVRLNATATTGSIEVGSNLVTVEDATGFAIGQQIIVEPRSGYGTMGPGGIWPEAAFDTESAILAATEAKPQGFVRALDTGRVYQAKPDGQGYYAWDPNLFYTNRAIPRPLVATIVSIAGRTLTLSTPARAGVSGATIAVDNHPILAGLTGGDGATFTLPAGTFALSGGVSFRGKGDWTIAGSGLSATVLRHLRGSRPTFLQFTESESPTVRDLAILGSHGWDGRQGIDDTPDGSGSNGYGNGISFLSCTNPLALNIAWQDMLVAAVEFKSARDGGRPVAADGVPFASEDGRLRNAYMAVNCRGRMAQPLQRYISWQYSVVDTREPGEFRDCAFDSDWMTAVFETFRSDGCRFVRPVSRNGLLACNSASNTIIDHPVFTFTANCRDRTVMGPIANQALFNLNSNIRNSSGQGAGVGGRIVNPTIIVEGWHDAGGSVMKAINMSDQAGWTVEGTYDPTRKDDGARLGLIRAPAPKLGVLASRPRPGSLEYACVSGPNITSDAPDTTVRGVMLEVASVDGMDRWPQYPPSIHLYAKDNSGSAVMDTITGTVSGSVSAPRARLSRNVSGHLYASLN